MVFKLVKHDGWMWRWWRLLQGFIFETLELNTRHATFKTTLNQSTDLVYLVVNVNIMIQHPTL